jgi:hypothetical protein
MATAKAKKSTAKKSTATGPALAPHDLVVVDSSLLQVRGQFIVEEIDKDGVVVSDPANPGVTYRVSVSDIKSHHRPVWHR